MKKIELYSGFVPEGTISYKGQYIYRVKAVREGAHGLGDGFPQPVFTELEPEGVGGIDGKIEITRPITAENPLNCRIHKYYLLDHDVWVRNLGGGKYISDWTPLESWAVAEERSYDADGNVTSVRELGFVIIHSDRRAGYVV